MLSHPDLPARILYPWADLYRAQPRGGQDYSELRPTYAIWLPAEDLLRASPAYPRAYQLRDERGRLLLDHGGIWLLELNKFAANRVETERQRRLKFFQDGERLDAARLPDWMQTDEMRQATSTLQAFSEKERAYHAYQARQNYLREQPSIQRHLEALEAQTETLQAEAERARAAREEERAAKEAERAPREVLSLPVHPFPEEREQDRVVAAVLAAVG